jgi:hypothetical protein
MSIIYQIADCDVERLDQFQQKQDRDRTKISPSDSESDHESPDEEGEDSDDAAEEGNEQSPLPLERPTDPLKAMEYDMIKALWYSSTEYPPDHVLISSMEEFSRLFFKLRDDWKKSVESWKAALENKNPRAEVAALKAAIVKQRELIDVAVNAAVQYGSPAILGP